MPSREPTSPRDVAREAAGRDVVRVTASHVAGGEIAASYFGPDRVEYIRALTDALTGASIAVTEEPNRLVATFPFSGRTLTILIP